MDRGDDAAGVKIVKKEGSQKKETGREVSIKSQYEVANRLVRGFYW